jgi:hypothetical protein
MTGRWCRGDQTHLGCVWSVLSATSRVEQRLIGRISSGTYGHSLLQGHGGVTGRVGPVSDRLMTYAGVSFSSTQGVV